MFHISQHLKNDKGQPYADVGLLSASIFGAGNWWNIHQQNAVFAQPYYSGFHLWLDFTD